MSKQQQPTNVEALEATINTLVSQLKSQPKSAKLPQQQDWVERHFSSPSSFEAVIWRLCWLTVIPGIFTLLWMPLSRWLWTSGYPLPVLLVCLSLGILYPLLYHFAKLAMHDRKLERLIDLQFTIPAVTVFFIYVWEFLKHG